MPALDKFDAIVTDPPYGIGADKGVGKYGKLKAGAQRWDDCAPDVSWVAKYPAIIWGGNYFGLPASRAFLVWDKGAGFKGRDFAECELAWCSFDANARIFSRDPLASGDYRGKQHPTQKPIALMQWCLGFLPGAETILDPFMGSGTTLVACAKLGRKGIGIELDAEYFDIAYRRVEEAYRQPDLFVSAPSGPQQMGFL
ncbi:DNA methyltransferase [Shimia ponticola]|uniref:DNA methyltransferase n=1 Tax=Shimia ponticola TaxID=2582893 RepID=UPI002106CE7D|nr:DNA methyltransferase [Shimia ponticola]